MAKKPKPAAGTPAIVALTAAGPPAVRGSAPEPPGRSRGGGG